MIRVLIVEDDAEKLRRVMICLEQVPGCERELIDNARDVNEAKRLLREKQYDLLIFGYFST